MKLKIRLSGLWASFGLFLAVASVCRSQVTIVSADLFNRVGQYYQAYANDPTNTVPVTSILGNTGGPQVWDFSSGPQDVTYRFDYIAATNGMGGSDFAAAGATLAEQKTLLSDTNIQSWLYFSQDPIKGRLDYGFYDPAWSSTQPQNTFTNVIQDFPNTIHFDDAWGGSTVFDSVYSDPIIGDFPDRVTYSSTDKVDAFGEIVLPNLGFLDCLRVHELVQYDIEFDLGDGSGLQHVATEYLINYYWLSPSHGIVAQITSTGSSDAKPDDSLPGGAAAFVRMFQTNHSKTTNSTPTTIDNFKCTLGGGGALLQWSPASNIKTYTVEYATNLVVNGSPKPPLAWTTLQTTTNHFVIDFNAATAAAPVRLYRVLGN